MKGRKGFIHIFRGVFAVIIGCTVIIAIGAGIFLRRQQSIISELEKSIQSTQMITVPLRFMVLSRGDTGISARFKLYNADGREISSFERSWNGTELYIDSLVVPLESGALAFPVRVFTDAVAPRGGTNLFPYYDVDGMPGIYDSSNLDAKKRELLKDLFSKLKIAEGLYGSRGNDTPGGRFFTYFGNAVHDVKQLRQFEIGTIYSLVVHADGGIEILIE